MIDRLTPEHIAALPGYRDKWLGIGLSTEPTDRAQAEAAMSAAYRAAGLCSPRFIWQPSPIHAMATLAASYGIDLTVFKVRDGVSSGVSGYAADAVNVHAYRDVAIQVGLTQDSVKQHVIAEIRDAALDEGINRWRGMVDLIGVESVIHESQRPVDNQVRVAVRARIGERVDANPWQGDWNICYGQHDAPWLSHFDALSPVVPVCERLQALMVLACHAGWCWPKREVCIMTPKHTVLRRDARHRLHCDDGPAIDWDGAWPLYSLHGVAMSREQVMMPAQEMTPAYVLGTQNVDQRRELIAKFGIRRLAEYGKLLEQRGEYRLIDFGPLLGSPFTPVAPYLLMANPSVPNTWHCEGVGRECQTVEQAINWRAGDIKMEWAPEQLS